MKKCFCVFVSLLLILFLSISAYADTPHNASLIEEYENLLTGEWKFIGEDPLSIGVSSGKKCTKFSFSPGKTDIMLFATPNDEIWLMFLPKKIEFNELVYYVSFNKDASYLVLTEKNSSNGYLFKRN